MSAQYAIIVLGVGARKSCLRSLRRLCERTDVAGPEYWSPWDSSESGHSISLYFPTASADAALVLARDMALGNPSACLSINVGTVRTGRGWATDARVMEASGSGDRFQVAQKIKTTRARELRTYVERADREDADKAIKSQHDFMADLPFGEAERIVRSVAARERADLAKVVQAKAVVRTYRTTK